MSALNPAQLRTRKLAWAVWSGVAAYVLAVLAPLPRPLYLPVEGTWTVSNPDGQIAIDYFGTLLWGALGFALGYGVGARLCARVDWIASLAARTVVLALVVLAATKLAHWAV